MISAVSAARAMKPSHEAGTGQLAGAGQAIAERLGLLPATGGEAPAGVVAGHDLVDGRPALAVTDQHQARQRVVRHGLERTGTGPGLIRHYPGSGPYSWRPL